MLRKLQQCGLHLGARIGLYITAFSLDSAVFVTNDFPLGGVSLLLDVLIRRRCAELCGLLQIFEAAGRLELIFVELAGFISLVLAFQGFHVFVNVGIPLVDALGLLEVA